MFSLQQKNEYGKSYFDVSLIKIQCFNHIICLNFKFCHLSVLILISSLLQCWPNAHGNDIDMIGNKENFDCILLSFISVLYSHSTEWMKNGTLTISVTCSPAKMHIYCVFTVCCLCFARHSWSTVCELVEGTFRSTT